MWQVFAKRNIKTLFVAQVLAFSAVPMLLFIGAIIGAELAPSESLATLPIAAIVVGTAIGAVPCALAMQRFGRKAVFIMAAFISALACLLIAHSLLLQSFLVYCAGIFIIGFCLAAMQQFRFAAIESVDAAQVPSAASAILLGGVFAAFIGPELAVLGRYLSSVEYQGSFYLVFCCFILLAAVLGFYQPELNSAAFETSKQEQQKNQRSLREILQTPQLWLAVSSAVVGYMVMSLVMTATPISMHHLHGHSLGDTKWVIQSHIAFMFLPSLLSPWLIGKLGLNKLIVLGLLC
jgi:predicted MFS family arabinose efflux permease